MARPIITACLATFVAALQAMSQNSVPPVYLTHFVIYVSPDTYDALKASPVIREDLGGFRESTTQAEGGALPPTPA